MFEIEREDIIDSLLNDFAYDLTEEELLNLITISNCTTWGLDDVEDLHTWNIGDNEIGFSVKLFLGGEPNEEMLIPFDSIWADVEGVASVENEKWKVSKYKVLNQGENVDYEDDFIKTVVSNVDYFKTFTTEIDSLRSLAAIKINDPKVKSTLIKQIFVGTITCLETYLSDALINKVLSNPEFLESFFRNYKFTNDAIKIKELINYENILEDIAKKEILGILFHNLPKVSETYENVLRITFPSFKDIIKAVRVRHDLVHRNGKTIDGKNVYIDDRLVEDLLDKVTAFIGEIDTMVKNKKTLVPVASSPIDFEDIPF